MCGIGGAIGVLDEASARRIAEAMARSMRHRGPDSCGTRVLPLADGKYLALAHTRLSIIDLSEAASQPMYDEDTGNLIVYNGEIYNFEELRRVLEAEGVRFRSRSDTEVLLKGYAKWGRDVLTRLRGMFAVAIWDASRHELFLGRDPFGIKPLYWSSSPGGGFSFASEIRAFVAAGLVPVEVDVNGLRSYLAFGSVQAPWTMLAGVRSLLPGEYLVFRGGLIERGRIELDLGKGIETADASSLVAHASATLKDSVKLHLVADVPVGVFLSGGIDSSVVTALATEVSDRVETFSIVFSEEGYSEAAYSRAVASLYGTSHHEIVLSERDLLGILPDALASYDQPSCDGVNAYVVARSVREAGFKVALSGLGGDEFFAGYSGIRRAGFYSKAIKALRVVPGFLRRAAANAARVVLPATVANAKIAEVVADTSHLLDLYMVRRAHWMRLQLGEILEPELSDGPLLDESVMRELRCQISRFDAINAWSFLETRLYMANTLLRDSDVMGMANSLEIRVPFVDRKVAAFAFSVPGEEKVRRGQKWLLRAAPARELPGPVWKRPKHGFELPFAVWMKGALRERIEAAFSHASPPGLRREGVLSAWRQFLSGSRYFTWVRLWGLFVLFEWWERIREGPH